MASDPLSAVLLVGLGYTRLSVAPPALSPIKWLIRSVPEAAARAAAEAALSAPTSHAVERALYEGVRNHVDLRLLNPRGPLPGK
jgi:signal transduction protein with GAF and PtsI domain